MYSQITKSARMSFADKVSWVGGMLGLFTGFSLISGLEVLYWLWFKIVLHDPDQADTREVTPVTSISVDEKMMDKESLVSVKELRQKMSEMEMKIERLEHHRHHHKHHHES